MRVWKTVVMIGIVVVAGCNADEAPKVSKGTPTTSTSPTTPESAAATQAPAKPASQTATSEEAKDAKGELRLEKLVFAIPEGWQRQQPSSSFVLAEFTLPRAEGANVDGRLTISSAGGSVEANVGRWRDQFGGKPDQAKDERKQIDGMEVVIVDFGGEYNDQRGPFGPPNKQPGYRMLGAIIPVGGELHFVKAVGPQATIAAHEKRIHALISSAKKK